VWVCDTETSTMRRFRSEFGCYATVEQVYFKRKSIYIAKIVGKTTERIIIAFPEVLRVCMSPTRHQLCHEISASEIS